MVHAALSRLDDRGRLDRGDEAPQRRARLRPASTQARRGRGVNLREALFAPQSVAIVGQSDDPAKTAGRPLKFLRQLGYSGRVYPINPRRDTVLGERAWPSLAALPEAPDHV